ncbi:hypothetical protein Zmor_009520 [Zophobas morio]|uniref:Uncharacterized protein n=1 Tax=Zophobas morio TaxID=2755281 RepID=A0AA38ILW8_9CUCU|nr:hypothetical protein Zmor_009520 [Zophobas morio]
MHQVQIERDTSPGRANQRPLKSTISARFIAATIKFIRFAFMVMEPPDVGRASRKSINYVRKSKKRAWSRRGVTSRDFGMRGGLVVLGCPRGFSEIRAVRR